MTSMTSALYDAFMDIVISAFSIVVLLLGLAIFSNHWRQSQDIPFELEPNRLLTRWPLLFVTGPRSLFYFSCYWNFYTVYLAEHGYEVFTLQLPWNSLRSRRRHLEKFLDFQEKNQKYFHLVLDSATFSEFEDLLRRRKSAALISLTEVQDNQNATTSYSLSAFPVPTDRIDCHSQVKASFFLELAYKFHRITLRSRKYLYPLASLSTLGAVPSTALSQGRSLLERAQTLAEMDLRTGNEDVHK